MQRREVFEKNEKLIKELLEKRIREDEELSRLVIDVGFRKDEDVGAVHYGIRVRDLSGESTFTLSLLDRRLIEKSEVEGILEKMKEIAENFRVEKELIKDLLKGKEPVLKVCENGEKVLYSCTLPELVQGKKVPKNLVGLVVGKQGITIKKLSLIAGKRIKVNVGEPLSFDVRRTWGEVKIPGFSERVLKKVLKEMGIWKEKKTGFVRKRARKSRQIGLAM